MASSLTSRAYATARARASAKAASANALPASRASRVRLVSQLERVLAQHVLLSRAPRLPAEPELEYYDVQTALAEPTDDCKDKVKNLRAGCYY